MFHGTWRVAVGLLWLLAYPWCAHARPPHKQALADYFGPFLAKSLNDCRTCHLADKSGQESVNAVEEKPHNPFGARLKEVRSELRKAGNKTGISDRIEAVAQEDSDGDGIPNLTELLTGHNPGDANDKPTAEEIRQAVATLADFRRTKAAYPWTPFEVVKRPALPEAKNTAWVRNPIDAFIAQEHDQRGLKPRPETSKPILLRRIYLDLIGLPPTREELHAFLMDTSLDAYERVVDNLLASPRYGERWGRHWMDVWRYSDWAGYGAQVRDSQPHIWRWRDWIIESLNTDKGYDRMVLEMLAADELAPEDTNTLRATGYLVRNYKLLSRETWMQEVVDHTFQGFLGVTLGCARCHDHMFDALLQKEYYQVRAVFEPHNVRIDKVPGQLDTAKDGLPRAFDANPDVKTVLYLRGDERTPDKTALQPGVPEVLGGHFPSVEPVTLPPAAYAPDKRAFVIAETRAASAEALTKLQAPLRSARLARERLKAALLQGIGEAPLIALTGFAALPRKTFGEVKSELDLLASEAKHLATVAALDAERLEDAGRKESEEWHSAAARAVQAQRSQALLEARLNRRAAEQAYQTALQRNLAESMRAEAKKKVEEAEKPLAKAEADAQMPAGTAYAKRAITTYPATSTGRRLALARWIADRENPLTARVAMNHLWLRHFGQAIVPSVYEFGRNGKPPTHPALLDWLAAEFIDRGWSMKTMHRLIVTSNTYRMASTPDPDNLARDADNQYLWRMPPRRVEAEVVRDAVFHVAGRLERTMGGPEIDYKLGLTVPRRTIYFRSASEKQMEFLKIFDAAAVTECYQRKASVMPQQALALANSELTIKQASLLAQDLLTGGGPDLEAFTTAAFEQVLSRPPTAEELSECVGFLKDQAGQVSSGGNKSEANGIAVGEPIQRACASLVHVLMNHNDFVTIR